MSISTIKKIPFTQVPNGLIDDEFLKPAVRFTFVFLYSKPDNWTFYRANVSKALGINIDTLDKYLVILEDRGWIKKRQKKSPDGTFGGMEIELFYEISDKEKTMNGLTDSEKNRNGENRERKNNEHNNTKPSNTKLKSNTNDLFQGTEFAAVNPNKKTLFEKSKAFDFKYFESKFSEPEFSQVDLNYYYQAVNNWSTGKNEKRTLKGWIATARNFMLRDQKANKLELKNKGVQTLDTGLMDYLKLSSNGNY